MTSLIRLSICLALLLTIGAKPADALITRSCTAYYLATIEQINGEPVRAARTNVPFGTFSASGGCGWTVADRCRVRAREAALQCALNQWPRRYRWGPVYLHRLCRVREIHNYSIYNWSYAVRNAVCPANRGNTLVVAVAIHVEGLSGCNWGQTLGRERIRC
jgi:hypothetical protein